MSGRVAWITGGGSGVGAAAAVRLAAGGWTVAVSGRRADHLSAAVHRVTSAGGHAVAYPLDVTDGAAIDAVVDGIEADVGPITTFVASAGLNTKRRFWPDLDRQALDDIIRVNLTSVAQCTAAVLPAMLRRGFGQIIVVSSRAARLPSPGAGVAYRMSKIGLRELVLDLNDRHHGDGIRATNLMPGDIATDFLDQRPDVPDTSAQAQMLTAEDVAEAIAFAAAVPRHVRIDELAISPSSAP
ncbi:SDR family oxidoreductase [Tsukamurella soli]|uniref:SDR family NAD(P)-dependent oxidoreductase n=1 Tax=Tsukamurella soli TaxID=644556 RepID=A0ABP8JUY6_9ACTN